MAEVEAHLRALLRDVLCGYLDTDLSASPTTSCWRPPRRPPRRSACATCASRSPSRAEADTSELEPVQPPLEGVTASADWDDYSAPV